MVTIISPDRILEILPKGQHIFRADLPKRQFLPQMPQMRHPASG